jgi:hypothetical protein
LYLHLIARCVKDACTERAWWCALRDAAIAAAAAADDIEDEADDVMDKMAAMEPGCGGGCAGNWCGAGDEAAVAVAVAGKAGLACCMRAASPA